MRFGIEFLNRLMDMKSIPSHVHSVLSTKEDYVLR